MPRKQEIVLEGLDEDMEKELVMRSKKGPSGKMEIEIKEEEKKEFTLSDLPGIGPATQEKLQMVGFNTVMSIATATPGELVEVTGMSEAAAKKIIAAARNGMDMGFISGEDFLLQRKKVLKIRSGSEALDALMGGGFETGAITEAFGEFGSGKTQIAHNLCIRIQIEDPTAVAVYIDTENTFRPERLVQLAKGAGLDPEQVLKNIKVARAYNSDHQMLLAEKVEDLITKDKLNVKLIVVDSLTAHFRAEFIGRGTLAERQQKLNRHMHSLMKLADTHNLAVYVTNQVMAKPDMFFGDPTQAIGGHVVAHASTFRIYLRKGKKGSRVAKLIDSPSLPEAECAFYVEESGLKEI